MVGVMSHSRREWDVLKWSSEDGERAAAGVLAERVPGRVGAREVGGAQDNAPAHQEGEENE